MDDINKKLADLLNDPDSMNRVREMAESILGSDNKQTETKSSASDLSSIFGGDIDPATLGKIMSIISKVKSNHHDNRAQLLLALKPHLSVPRREKVDTAIKLLKLIDLLPLIQESGMFEF